MWTRVKKTISLRTTNLLGESKAFLSFDHWILRKLITVKLWGGNIPVPRERREKLAVKFILRLIVKISAGLAEISIFKAFAQDFA